MLDIFLGRKKNHRSISVGIRALRIWAGFETHRQLADHIMNEKNRLQRAMVKEDKLAVTGTHESHWSKVESNTMKISLRALQVLAYATGVPMGIFLASTHINAYIRHKNLEHAKKYALGMKAVADKIIELSENHEMKESERFSAIFKTWKDNGVVTEKFLGKKGEMDW